ncbi:Mo-dependent nitrogenase C-terminal domain-containing protein [Pseudanabaena sp. FACHB-2040]|uniref:Mo-dependent nitrogenase C-terminal domain-containing protein n=1 Tax=Pseudanabaena sp. FACHB-2040 TaxID=2692859 RepID=UPI0016871ABB|nr:Mo-dependent nitrogenase C-terminal domain-containing protein [Pseudanabaena sp. FACHB-2040]MBD2260658.1 nitrogenase [Pseudanabaena sp. FACHB-2040]
MPATAESPYTQEQIKVWLRGLLTIAWADGHFDEDEKGLITSITQKELAPSLNFDHFKPVSAEELKAVMGCDRTMSENFLRMAVMVALADGVYSTEEDVKLQSFCIALELEQTVLDSLRLTLYNLQEPPATSGPASPLHPPQADGKLDPLKPARVWLDQLEVHDPRLARFVCKLIPPQCPFERDVVMFGHKLIHIPPMCKLNPLYDQLVGLRFRALSYLADDCGEDVTPYI